jgi:hypothetical protein
MSPKTKKKLDSIVTKLRALRPQHDRRLDRDKDPVENYFGHLRYRGDQIEHVYEKRGLEVLCLLRKTALELKRLQQDLDNSSSSSDSLYDTNHYNIGCIMDPEEINNRLRIPDLHSEIVDFLNDVHDEDARHDGSDDELTMFKPKLNLIWVSQRVSKKVVEKKERRKKKKYTNVTVGNHYKVPHAITSKSLGIIDRIKSNAMSCSRPVLFNKRLVYTTEHDRQGDV